MYLCVLVYTYTCECTGMCVFFMCVFCGCVCRCALCVQMCTYICVVCMDVWVCRYVCAYVCLCVFCIVWYRVRALCVCVFASVHIPYALCIRVHIYVESAGMSAHVEPNQKDLLAVNSGTQQVEVEAGVLGLPPPPPHSNGSAFCPGFSF